MKLALNELKIKAKKLQKQDEQKEVPKLGMQRKHYLQKVALDVGFGSWQHASQLLAGQIRKSEGLDYGSFFHSHACDTLINQWFSKYEEARNELDKTGNSYLVPYKRHFVVARGEYLRAIGIHKDSDNLLKQIDHDFVSGYGSDVWDQLALCVIASKR